MRKSLEFQVETLSVALRNVLRSTGVGLTIGRKVHERAAIGSSGRVRSRRNAGICSGKCLCGSATLIPVRRARLVAAARREFLAEVGYYSKERADLGARFTA